MWYSNYIVCLLYPTSTYKFIQYIVCMCIYIYIQCYVYTLSTYTVHTHAFSFLPPLTRFHCIFISRNTLPLWTPIPQFHPPAANGDLGASVLSKLFDGCASFTSNTEFAIDEPETSVKTRWCIHNLKPLSRAILKAEICREKGLEDDNFLVRWGAHY